MTMVAITAQLYGSTTPPLVQVAVTGVTGVTAVTVWAEPPNSPRRVVRGGLDVDPSSDALLLVDPLPELGRPIIYVVEWTAGGTRYQLSSTAVTVPDPGRHVLSHPFSGRAVLVDVLADGDERENEQRGSVLYPVGARYGVALYDGRLADVGTLNVWADAQSVAELVELLGDGAPVVSRHPNDGCDIPPLEVLNVSSVTRVRRSRAGDRLLALPFSVVAQPDLTEPASTATLADIAAHYGLTGKLSDLAADFPTLLSVGMADWVA